MVHYASHVLFSMILISFYVKLVGPLERLEYALSVVFATIVPDLDHILVYIFQKKRYKMYRANVFSMLKKGKIIQAIGCHANHHKEVDSLYTHNVYFLLLVLIVLISAGVMNVSSTIFISFIAFILHYIILGPIKRWTKIKFN